MTAALVAGGLGGGVLLMIIVAQWLDTRADPALQTVPMADALRRMPGCAWRAVAPPARAAGAAGARLITPLLLLLLVYAVLAIGGAGRAVRRYARHRLADWRTEWWWREAIPAYRMPDRAAVERIAVAALVAFAGGVVYGALVLAG